MSAASISSSSEVIEVDRSDVSPDWAAYAQLLRKYDDEVVRRWKEEIDTLLVFAGLFSAIVTTFNIEAYKFLQADPSQSTVLLLQQISLQLAQANNNSVATENSPISAATNFNQTFRPSTQIIRINVLWFSSLVCALFSALIGIMVKQWIREYTAASFLSSKDSMRLRQHRYEGLIAWRVPEIMAFLPILLEFSLILFFVGLIDFLLPLDHILAIIVTSLIALALLFYAATTAAPVFSTRCPFKSPQAWLLHQTWQRAASWLYQLSCSMNLLWPLSLSREPEPSPHLSDWTERDKLAVRGDEDELDLKVTTWIYVSSIDESIQSSLLSVIPVLSPDRAALFVFGVLAHKVNIPTPSFVALVRSRACFDLLRHSRLHADRKERARIVHMLLKLLEHIPRINDPMELGALDVVWTVWELFLGASMAEDQDAALSQAVLNGVARLISESEPFRLQRAALNLLFENTHIWAYLCPPFALTYIVAFAQSCEQHRILDMFMKATAVALFLASEYDLEDPSGTGGVSFHRQQLRALLRDLAVFLQRCNEHGQEYDLGGRSVAKLVHGLAVLDERDPELIDAMLPDVMLEGIELGLLHLSEEEKRVLRAMHDARLAGEGARRAGSMSRLHLDRM